MKRKKVLAGSHTIAVIPNTSFGHAVLKGIRVKVRKNFNEFDLRIKTRGPDIKNRVLFLNQYRNPPIEHAEGLAVSVIKIIKRNEFVKSEVVCFNNEIELFVIGELVKANLQTWKQYANTVAARTPKH